MSEPFGNKWKKYKVWPSVLGQSGGTIDHKDYRDYKELVEFKVHKVHKELKAILI